MYIHDMYNDTYYSRVISFASFRQPVVVGGGDGGWRPWNWTYYIDILLIPTINMVGGQKNAKDEIQFVIKLLETENI